MSITGIGARLPIARDPDGDYMLLQNLKGTARQNLKMIVLTDPGERVRMPGFGAGVRRLLFENTGGQILSAVKGRIKSQAATYIPWIDIGGVTTSMNPDSGVLSIVITFSIPALGGVRDILSIPIN
tara:strand:- start:12685 stop:13062 length:378 start_codon:yes stop_codon:yes gene_type:complete